MRSLQFSAYGDPSAFRLVDIPAAPVGPGQVRIAIEAAPLNPSDFLLVDGRYALRPELPSPAGAEGLGRVIEAGADVDRVAVGDRALIVPSGPIGTWQDEIVTDQRYVLRVDRDVDPLQLATVGINAATAHLLLDYAPELTEGSWIAQTAANSNLGEYVIALAARRGLRTLNIVRRPEAADAVRAAGGDAVLVADDTLDDQVAAALDGQRLGLVLDGVGGELPGVLAAHLVRDGHIVSYAALSGRPVQVPPMHLNFHNLSVDGFWLNNFLLHAPATAVDELYRAVIDLVADGVLKTTITATYDLAEWQTALTQGRRFGRDGKVVFTPGGAA